MTYFDLLYTVNRSECNTEVAMETQGISWFMVTRDVMKVLIEIVLVYVHINHEMYSCSYDFLSLILRRSRSLVSRSFPHRERE